MLRLWRCPICKDEVRALATSVAHHCPKDMDKVTNWEEVNEYGKKNNGI